MPSDDMTKAGEVLQNAFKAVMSERGQQHGSATDSFTMIAEFWTLYLKHKHMHMHGIPLQLSITPTDIAQMMSLLKKSRALYGDQSSEDNYVDDVGYTAVARHLQNTAPAEGDLDFGSALTSLDRDKREAAQRILEDLEKREKALQDGIATFHRLVEAKTAKAGRGPTPSEPIPNDIGQDLMDNLASLMRDIPDAPKQETAQ